MKVPQSIKDKKPTQFGAVEIRCFGENKFYVYKISSKWDPVKKKAKKVTGKSIGKITEADGFIPNATGMKLMMETGISPDIEPVVKKYGAYEMFRQISPEIDEQLKKFFPDIFREIRTISLLRLVDGISSAKMIQPAFLDSYMSDICSDIAVSETSVRKFVSKLGAMQNTVDEFMKSSIMPGTTLLFDGTSVFTKSQDSLSAKGYNPNHSLNPQARILYVFEKDTHRPVFYRIFQGSIVDKTAFTDTVQLAGLNDCVIIADKGFYSKKNLSALMDAGLRFVLPLQSNTTNVEQSFYEDRDDSKFDGVFSYNHRPIWYRKKKSGSSGNFIYTFRDDMRRTLQIEKFVSKAEGDYGEQERKAMDVLKEVRMGYFSFCSNVDTDAREIYLLYKQRWDIEECFDYLKNSVSPSASHAHTDEYFRGWTFLNHISLMYYYGLLNALREKKLDDRYSADDAIKLTKNIYKVRIGDSNSKYRVSAVQKKTRELLKALEVDLLREI